MATQSQQLLPFRAGCRTIRIPAGSESITKFGQTCDRIKAVPTGYLHKFWLNLQGSITSGAGTPNGAWASYPHLPESLISKIRVFSTPGTDLINIGGDTLKSLLRQSRRNCYFSAAAVAEGGNTQYAAVYQTNTGNTAASTQYNFAASWEIPISTDDALLWGLLPIQNDAVLVYIEVTLNSQANVTSETGVTMTPSFTVTVMQESIIVLSETGVAAPNLQFAHKIIETPQSITKGGDNIYKPLIGPTYLRHLIQLENNSAAMVDTNINNVAYRFAQQAYIINEDYPNHKQFTLAYNGAPLPIGQVFIDATDGQGVPGVVDTRDMINTSQQTDVGIVINIGTATLTSAQLRAVDEYLTPL